MEKNHFKLEDDFILNDTYYTKNNKTEVLDLLSDYILLREVVGERNQIVLKQKRYDDQGNITSQLSKKCTIENIEDAKGIFENIGYTKFFYMSDHNYLYNNGINQIYVQVIEDNIYLEVEEENNNVKGVDRKSVV